MLMLKAYATGGSGGRGGIQSLIKGGEDKWGYSEAELKRLANAHRNGNANLRRQIENRLTDINYHTEASSFRNGTYTTLSSEGYTSSRPMRGSTRLGYPRVTANPRRRSRGIL